MNTNTISGFPCYSSSIVYPKTLFYSNYEGPYIALICEPLPLAFANIEFEV